MTHAETLTTKRITFKSRFSDYELTEATLKLPPAPTQIYVRTSATALNPIDVKIKSAAVLPWTYHVGRDFSGVVEHVGSAYHGRFAKGDRVCGIAHSKGSIVGTWTVIDAAHDKIEKAPENVTDEEAAAFPLVLGTAWGLVEAATGLNKDSRVVVLGGATSVGTFVIQILSSLKRLETIVSVNSAASKEEVALAGATQTIDYKTEDVPAVLAEMAKVEGLFDFVFDTAGGTDVLEAHKSILKPASEHGKYITVAGDAKPSSSYNTFIGDTIKSVPNVVARSLTSKRFHDLDWSFTTISNSSWLKEAKEHFEKGRLSVRIDSTYPLADFKKAIEHLTSVKARGKVVISMQE